MGDTERATLMKILKDFKLTNRARLFLQSELKVAKPSYHKTIQGVKYDRELLEAAEAFAKDGQVSYPEARRLWEDAQDGEGVTQVERATLEYIMKECKVTDKASKFLKTMLEVGQSSSYYLEDEGVKYDRALLEKAKVASTDGQVSVDEAKNLWEDAKDGKGITDTERLTLEYALKDLKFTEPAKEFLTAQLKA